MEHDKRKSCKGCPDRVVEPNCHNTCEGYLYRCERQRKINEVKAREFEADRVQKTSAANMKAKKRWH